MLYGVASLSVTPHRVVMLPGLVAAADVIPLPVVAYHASLTPGLVTADDVFHVPSIASDQILLPGLAASDDSVAAPTVLIPTQLGSATNVTLSNGNLTATHTNTSTAGARSPDGKNSGKHHFRVTLTTVNGASSAVCVMTAAATYTNVVVDGTNCFAAYAGSGNLWSNGANSGMTIGALSSGDLIDVEIDLDADLGWMRKNGGNWNGSGGANPATGSGGVSLSSYSGTTVSPAVCFSGNSSEVATALFGGGNLSAVASSGFFPGWAS